jgi:hypothetical protein
MGSGHGHGFDDGLDEIVRPEVRRAMWAAVGCCALAVLVGLLVLWPRGADSLRTDPAGLGGEPVKATVDRVEEVPCSFDPLLGCKRIELRLTDGDRGEFVLEQSIDSTITAGDGILVDVVELGDGRSSSTTSSGERRCCCW